MSASFVIVGEADCEAGKFLDEVSLEARRNARTVNAYEVETGELVGELAGVLTYVHRYGRLTSHEHELVAAALAKFNAWRQERGA